MALAEVGRGGAEAIFGGRISGGCGAEEIGTGIAGTSTRTIPGAIWPFLIPWSSRLACCPAPAFSTKRWDISMATTWALTHLPSVPKNPISAPTETDPSSAFPVTTMPRPGMKEPVLNPR